MVLLSIWEILGLFYENFVFVYGVTLLLIYAMLATLSLLSIRAYMREDSYTDYDLVVSSKLAPGVSVIAPAYNEAVTIISNVRSLLTLNYPQYEVILVNDGSTDDTLQQMINEFSMVKVDYAYDVKIQTYPVKGIYKSTNPAYARLLVVDKVNGKSKADATNAGINASAFDYFLCTDVDCILDKDTIQKLLRPVMTEDKYRVIATGATLRLTNSCEIDEGLITKIRAPRQLLPRFQEMEYIRAFVMGKMGWTYINAVPNVSGGLGFFDKEIAIKAGGYDAKSFGEDMELVTRMCGYMMDNKMPYAIRHIPVTLCWTEGPSTLKIFMRQRTRWGRGLAQLMMAHMKMFANPRYGKMGMIVFTYNFFFELLAPIIEFFGIIYYVYLIMTDGINWPYAIILLMFVYTYSVLISTISILWDQITFKYYKTNADILRMCSVVFIEMFIYHPLIVFFALRGYYFFLTGRKHAWGDMQRRGFNKATPDKTQPTAVQNNTQ